MQRQQQRTIDQIQLKKHVDFLSQIKPPRNFNNLKSLERAARYIEKYWTGLGLTVRRQKFKVEGKEYFNVITRIGTDKSKPLMVIGAHYDVFGDFPGADDNASAVSGLLELSFHLKKLDGKLDKNFELVAYSLEEPPFFRSENMGSWVHAKDLFDQQVKVKLMVCLEMIGYFTEAPDSQDYPAEFLLKWIYPSVGDFIVLVGGIKEWFIMRKLKALFMQHSSVNVESINAPATIPGIDFSDHLNYWKFGYPAIMVTDTSFYRNKNYHTEHDTSDTLNYPKMARVIKGVLAMVLKI
ncbi:MAG: M28 family peptidase [Bacteriovoracaceae bacterium]|nr:M28 family peptidase [Bacteriovoracaceae bacterium]